MTIVVVVPNVTRANTVVPTTTRYHAAAHGVWTIEGYIEDNAWGRETG